MIFPSLYEELDLQRYATLTRNILKHQDVLVTLLDDSGQIVWINGDKSRLAKFTLDCDEEKILSIGNVNCHYKQQSHNGANVVSFSLGELAGRSTGVVVFYDTGDISDDEINKNYIISALWNIVGLVKTELGYLYEVNSMASELGERYDELTMLRTTDLALEEYKESRHILSTYIRSFADHLNVDYAAIWIPSRQAIYPGGIAYERGANEVTSLLEQLSVSAYAMFQDGHEGFGINDKDKNLRHALKLPADKKVLIVPVLDAMGKPCGVLSCVNEFYNKDFTSSDKATLDAVSRKTGKYLLNTQDVLTGLLNRKGFEESIWRELIQTEADRHLVMFNINQFKTINAAYGMTTGDIVLASLAETMKNSTHQLKFVARLDSDVFAALIHVSKSEVESVVNKICDEIDAMPISVDGKDLSISSRAGVISLNSKETALADHLYAAELALSSAKDDVENRVVVYKPGNTALMKHRHQLTLVENIKNALQEDRFELYCQRIRPLSGNEIHYEILIRMIDESGDIIMPDEFIPVAERYNLMNKVDRWVIKHTFELLNKEEYRDLATNFKWGINLSGLTIGDRDFHDYVSDCLREYKFPPTNLYFEITETAAIKNFQNCVFFMNKIHSLGVQFALDDFGSGLSSFSYLKKLSIDYLKIDGSLVRDIVSSRLDQVMVSAIADIAKVLNVKTIAEYVENDLILEKLNSLNIDYAQGYGIMKPKKIELELKRLAESTECKLSSNN